MDKEASVFRDLIAGHERYMTGKMKHPNLGHEQRSIEAKGQDPKICILACADSRVPPELIFDQGLGDMFVVRVAGNFADEDNQASIEYAVQHFHPKPAIIVVLGHERCGAVQGAAISFDAASVDPAAVAKFNQHVPSEHLVALVTRLKPAIDNTKLTELPVTPEDVERFRREGKFEDRIDQAVRWNVRDQVGKLQGNDVIHEAGVFVIGARYDLDTGEIEWLTPKPE